MGASPAPLPLGPVVQLQFALAYINMAVPSTVGRLATMIRFFQRVGASAATAIGVGAIDSMANLVVQIGLTFGTLALGLGSLDLDLTSHLSDLDVDMERVVLLIVLGAVATVAVVLIVPKFRAHVLPALETRNGLAVLDESFQTSVPGLFMTSMLAVQDFGPFFAFTGAVRTSTRLIGDALARQPRPLAGAG